MLCRYGYERCTIVRMADISIQVNKEQPYRLHSITNTLSTKQQTLPELRDTGSSFGRNIEVHAYSRKSGTKYICTGKQAHVGVICGT